MNLLGLSGVDSSQITGGNGVRRRELTSVDATEDEEESENGDGVEVHGVKR